jgi:hypothetical protein|tara:strand:- start:15336 stop:15533 length:198 start_codon:yes stop_codon:yes gene_type:complete
MIRIELDYSEGREVLYMTNDEVAAELATFLNAYNDSGKKQWVSKIKGEAISNPWTSGSYPSNLES